MDKTTVIIVAGGSGSRMGGLVPKQFLPLGGKPLLVHTVERFRNTLPHAAIIVAIAPSEAARWIEISAQHSILDSHTVCQGGKNRFESVANALAVAPAGDYVMVHDGVRPLASAALILRCLETARRCGTAIPAVEPVDSLRLLTGDGCSAPLDRAKVRAVQTPQVFRDELIRRAYQTAFNPAFTDDASVVEHAGTAITLCPGENSNIKITTPADLAIAEALLAQTDASQI